MAQRSQHAGRKAWRGRPAWVACVAYIQAKRSVDVAISGIDRGLLLNVILPPNFACAAKSRVFRPKWRRYSIRNSYHVTNLATIIPAELALLQSVQRL